MARYVLSNDTITAPNGSFGTFGDLPPRDLRDLVAGDELICGDDIVTGSGYLAGDTGQNLALGSQRVKVVGGNDTITGSSGTDIINGGGGTDVIDGGGGLDYLEYIDFAAAPDDRVIIDLAAGRSWSTFFGNDTFVNIEGAIGSLGGDWIAGDAGANALYGYEGDDVVYGRGGHDSIDGGSGNDALYGEAGDDVLVDAPGLSGSSGSNWMSGGDGNDALTVSGGKVGEWSALHGDAGNDTVRGFSNGSSVGLYGGAGNDLIQFGSGTAYIHGGNGADLFGPMASAFTDAGSFGQVFDFEDGIDKVTVAAVAGAKVEVRDWGANTGLVITDGAGKATTLMLMGITAAQFDPATDLLGG